MHLLERLCLRVAWLRPWPERGTPALPSAPLIPALLGLFPINPVGRAARVGTGRPGVACPIASTGNAISPGVARLGLV